MDSKHTVSVRTYSVKVRGTYAYRAAFTLPTGGTLRTVCWLQVADARADAVRLATALGFAVVLS